MLPQLHCIHDIVCLTASCHDHARCICIAHIAVLHLLKGRQSFHFCVAAFHNANCYKTLLSVTLRFFVLVTLKFQLIGDISMGVAAETSTISGRQIIAMGTSVTGKFLTSMQIGIFLITTVDRPDMHFDGGVEG